MALCSLSVCLSCSLSLWLLSGFLVFSFHLSICLPGSQPTMHCAYNYPTVGNCSSGTLAVISLPIQMRKHLPAERQEGVWFTFRCLCYMDRELIITRLCTIRPSLKILAWKGPVNSLESALFQSRNKTAHTCIFLMTQPASVVINKTGNFYFLFQ